MIFTFLIATSFAILNEIIQIYGSGAGNIMVKDIYTRNL